ncbi:MAG: hypothetical protein GWN37_05070, partial [Gammaproteobacteria bacterium]|nr:hypothetical protein [Gammaproteobacteria bacterium]
MSAGEENLLGWALLQSGRRQRAIGAFERSLEIEPALHDSFCGLGFAYLRGAEYATSLEYFDRAAQGDPGPECIQGRDRAHAAAAAHTVSIKSEPQPAVDYVARGNYFWRRAGDAPFEIVYVKGVNLSFARPGKHITEFPRETAVYLEWFGLVREMHANVIRVYTILPPEFYQALLEFNLERDMRDRLLLVQGIWAELPEGSRFRDAAYVSEVQAEIRSAVDVVHGRASIEHRYGHAHGEYHANVSNHVLAFIFGREWEPSAVSRFHDIDSTDRFRGEYLGIDTANPMEAWLTEMLDGLVAYEQKAYGTQRPVAWMS